MRILHTFYAILVEICLVPRLGIPGLSEGKPSVLIGDRILLQKHGDVTDSWYEGVVHKVSLNEVTLHLGSNFSMHKHASRRVDVRFKLNRMPLRRGHQAVTIHNKLARILFPGPEHILNSQPVNSAQMAEGDLVDRTLADNVEQMKTVATIIAMPPGSVPFIVYGP